MGHWVIDTAGIGSLIVVVVAVSVLAAYLRMLRWIRAAPNEPVVAQARRSDVTGDNG